MIAFITADYLVLLLHCCCCCRCNNSVRHNLYNFFRNQAMIVVITIMLVIHLVKTSNQEVV